ncbi:unnamed protein product, partial [Nesidiocoris tenuis]
MKFYLINLLVSIVLANGDRHQLIDVSNDRFSLDAEPSHTGEGSYTSSEHVLQQGPERNSQSDEGTADTRIQLVPDSNNCPPDRREFLLKTSDPASNWYPHRRSADNEELLVHRRRYHKHPRNGNNAAAAPRSIIVMPSRSCPEGQKKGRSKPEMKIKHMILMHKLKVRTETKRQTPTQSKTQTPTDPDAQTQRSKDSSQNMIKLCHNFTFQNMEVLCVIYAPLVFLQQAFAQQQKPVNQPAQLAQPPYVPPAPSPPIQSAPVQPSYVASHPISSPPPPPTQNLSETVQAAASPPVDQASHGSNHPPAPSQHEHTTTTNTNSTIE